MASTSFVGVDWGTSSFRAWLFGPLAEPEQICRSDRGMALLEPDEFAPYLAGVLHRAGVSSNVPVIICGMAGARDGWQEAAYVSAPTKQLQVARKAVRVAAGSYNCTILPGVCLVDKGRFDVMRGEETILFGALSYGAQDGTFCLPGTHSKWCRIERGNLVDWQTVMTGELFALLSSQSTLSRFCDGSAENLHETPAFQSAVREALQGSASAMHKLFSIRARALLDSHADSLDFPARLSGLLIGQEIAGMTLDKSAPVTLVSSGAIGQAYDAALSIAGCRVRAVNAETATLAGLSIFADELFADLVERVS